MNSCEWKRVKRDNYVSFKKELFALEHSKVHIYSPSCGYLIAWDDKFDDYIFPSSDGSYVAVIQTVQEVLDARRKFEEMYE